jgi:hypothetical protein
MDKKSIQMQFKKETPGTYVYVEISSGTTPPSIPTVYIKKYAVGENPPQKIQVTIEPVA